MGTAVELAPGVWRIPTAPHAVINSFALVSDDGQVTLVDCGTRRAPARIVAGLAAIGKRPADVTRIVLTHVHADHAGGVASMRSHADGVGVTVHAGDAQYARRGQSPPSDPATLLGRLMNRVPDTFSPFAVDHELADGEVLDVAGGLAVLHTPGHTPGHVSLHHLPTGVLITGDAVHNLLPWRGPVLAGRVVCTDHRLTRASAQRLGVVELSLAAFTHGPEIRRGAQARLRRALDRYA